MMYVADEFCNFSFEVCLMVHKATGRRISYKEITPTFINCGSSAPKIPEQNGLGWIRKILYICFLSGGSSSE
jgi:hypothetical protein